jgi:hypothetical protein
MPAPLTDEQLADLEALHQAAEPGTWRNWDPASQPAEIINDDGLSLGRIWHRTDADFTVAAQNHLPALLAEIRQHRGTE